MSSLFQTPSSGNQPIESLDFTVADELKSAKPEMLDGLVSAAELPSAVDVLAQLFPPERDALGRAQESPKDPFEESAAPPPSSPGSSDGSDSRGPSSTPYDPYSLASQAGAHAKETAADKVAEVTTAETQLAGSDKSDPAASTQAARAENAVLETSRESAPTQGGAVTSSNHATEKTQTADVAASHSDSEPGHAPAPREKGSFQRVAMSIRSLLSGGRRSRAKEARQNITPALEAASGKAVPAVPEADPPAAETVVPPPESTDALASLPEAPALAGENSKESQLPEISEPKASEPIVAAETTASTENPPALTESAPAPEVPSASLEASQATPAPEAVEAAPVDPPPASVQGQQDSASSPVSSEGGFFHEEAAAEEWSPVAEPRPEQAAEAEQEEFDSSDDDQAIAAAIERYANTTAAAAQAQPQLSPSAAALVPDVQPADHSNQPVDINAILEIPRDPEPADSAVGSAVFSAPLADTGPVAVPENTLPSAKNHVLPDVESPLTNVPAHELPENNSPSHLSSIPYRDWSFEEKLASHHEWIESKGRLGKKADLSGVDLEASDLIGVDLRFVDLHDANMRAADLLMADLRDACLVRANFRDSCLVGANLEGANLEGASLETALGLVPRQLAGTNLHEASLPKALLQFEGVKEFKRASRQVHGFFAALMSMCALSALLIWMTKDFQLVTNSAVLFFLHSASAAAALPTVQFYLIGPLAIFVLYLVFQFHLQHLWDLALELPAVFPDGHTIGESEPRIVLGLLRAHFHWMNVDAPSTRFVEKGISIFLAYWIVPIALTLYWVRFLTLQELRGTILQELLIVSSTAVALYATTKVGKPAQRWTIQENAGERAIAKLRDINPVTPSLVLLGVLTFLAVGTMTGIPHSKQRAPQFVAGSVRRWAPTVLWSFGLDPYADLTEATISRKPANWNGADDQVRNVDGARLNGVNFRYAQAYRAFMVNAHLLHSNLQGAFLSQADLRGADLGQSNLNYTVLDQAQMNHVNLDRATLEGANLSRADLRAANLSYAAMDNANLVDARLNGATLYGAKLLWATLIRTNFENADLREAQLEGANLEHVDMQGAYLWSAKLMGARLANAQLGKAIFVNADLHGADLRWAHLSETVLTGADLTAAYLDGADLRGAVGFGANQICSAKSRHGLLLDDAMQLQVTAQCGAGN